ncbi:hypothetical protein [Petrimonas sulfuriphila]|uniref:hypothetical protein n=1 Tax=Petrimonas sulfuriphila TaxID=285070 RepID=UPI003EBB8FED
MEETIKKLIELAKKYIKVGREIGFQDGVHTVFNQYFNIKLNFGGETFDPRVYFNGFRQIAAIYFGNTSYEFEYANYSDKIQMPLSMCNESSLSKLLSVATEYYGKIEMSEEEKEVLLKKNKEYEIKSLKDRLEKLENS